MGCGEFLVKYILFFVNLFFALAGLTLLGLGVAVQLQVSVIVNHVESFQIAPISAMVIGSIVFLISFFGCCGAVKESNCMLITYSVFMIVLMILKIALACVIFINLDKFVSQVPTWLNQTFTNSRDSFHELEKALKCCGTTGPAVYLPSPTLPDTCCATPPCIQLVTSNYQGCNGVVEDFFTVFGNVIGIILIVVIAVELVAVVFGLCLANHVRNKYRRAQY